MHQTNLIVLVGGSDLFSGMRGVSKGTKIIQQNLKGIAGKMLVVNYNYFLDFGKAVQRLHKQILTIENSCKIILYGYSKGGDVVLQLARLLEGTHSIELVITVDVANGPWSHKINRQVPGNVKKNINVYQTNPNFPFRSYGMPSYSSANIIIENINVTNRQFENNCVNHSNIERFTAHNVIDWIKNSLQSTLGVRT
jgi:hypothetical protein